MDKLTKRQEDIIQFIKKYIVSNGYPPTVREIGYSLGLSSPATIHSHLSNLEDKGYIKKDDKKNRAIELLIDNEFIKKDESIVSVPLLGKITAGNPIEAIHNPNEYFSLPAYMIPTRKEVFTLKVSGESMIEAGIFDNDIVIVERTNDAKNGDIVVAMTNENEVTLKRFYKEKTYIRLHPENKAMEDIILDDVTILGKAIGLYRKF
ncbi:MAG: transcriptional repressor LexA [Tenericutes bacterium]|jgi:repressor LexA|nr:transcriptional repressor LexA [Bacilli bacterium]NLV90106.1 transcriptional repressor LexA [Mycoplasmatota bacterium]